MPDESTPPRRKRTWKRAIVERLIIYPLLMPATGICLMIGGCADRLLLFPSRNAEPTFGADRVDLPFQGQRLEFMVDRPEGDPERYVIVFTGNGTRAELIGTAIQPGWPQGTEVWTMNYPGFGGSTGKPELDDLPPAGLAAFDHVQSLADGKPIYLVGISLGTTIASYVASERPAKAIVLEHPAAVQSIILRRYGWFNLWTIAGPIAWQVPREMNIKKTLPKVNVPILMSLAMNDVTVPTKYQLEVAAMKPNAIVLKYPDVGHEHFVFTDDQKVIRKAIIELIGTE